jgi:hypothetical protein
VAGRLNTSAVGRRRPHGHGERTVALMAAHGADRRGDDQHRDGDDEPDHDADHPRGRRPSDSASMSMIWLSAAAEFG